MPDSSATAEAGAKMPERCMHGRIFASVAGRQLTLIEGSLIVLSTLHGLSHLICTVALGDVPLHPTSQVRTQSWRGSHWLRSPRHEEAVVLTALLDYFLLGNAH